MVVHTDLAYPEGVAAAEILKAGSHSDDTDGKSSGLKEIMAGSVISGIVALLTNGFQMIAGGLSGWGDTLASAGSLRATQTIDLRLIRGECINVGLFR